MKGPEGLNIVVYDTEIKEGWVSTPGVFKEFGPEDFQKMGISVACLWDYRDGDMKVYLDDNMADLALRLNSADLIVGFNINKFDIPLVENTLNTEITAKTYDELYYSRRSVGWMPGSRYYPKAMSLDQHLIAMYGESFKKTEDAAQAPAMYQNGQMGRLISYCSADVMREKKVFEECWFQGKLKTVTHGEREVIRPQAVLESKELFL